MARPCTVCVLPGRVEADAALAAGASYRLVAAAHGVTVTAVFRHVHRHLAEPIRRQCPGCGKRLAGAERRCGACRTVAAAERAERAVAERSRRVDADAWLLTADARWSSLPDLRRERRRRVLCVVCAGPRPPDRCPGV